MDNGDAAGTAGLESDDSRSTNDHQVRFGSGSLDRAKDKLEAARQHLIYSNKWEAQEALKLIDEALSHLGEELPA